MRIAVYGVGGAGGYFGAQLIRGGESVAFIARGDHLEAIRSSGLHIEMDDGEIVVAPDIATDDPADVGTVDVVLLGVKAHQVREVAPGLLPLLGDQSFVVPLQNGVETVESLVAAVGEGHVVGGLCGTVTWVVGPGRLRSLGKANFIRFGELDDRPSVRTERLREAFEHAGVTAEIPPDIRVALWEKFLFVVSVGGVSALHDMTVGEIRQNPETRAMLQQCMAEIRGLAVARGVPLDADLESRTMAFVDRLPADGTASLHRDISASRPSELDAWNGAVVRLAAESGIDVPAHRAIVDGLRRRIRESTAGCT